MSTKGRKRGPPEPRPREALPPPGAPVVFRDVELVVPQPTALDRALRDHHPGSSWNDVRKLVRSGKVRVAGTLVTDPAALVPPGAAVSVRMSAPRITAAAPLSRDAIVFLDAHVVVVRKPAGIATVPFEDERDTLDRLVAGLVRKLSKPGTSVAPLGVVQRLDKDTSGLLVFARNSSAKRELQQQLRFHTVHRRYVAIAHGRVEATTFRSRLVQDRGDGLRGSTTNPELGREAVTHVRVIERLSGATLVECELETGRTHQIRIHLAESGHPLLGERIYTRGYRGPLLPAPRLMLHAAELGFEHPATGKLESFEDPLPPEMAEMLRALQR